MSGAALAAAVAACQVETCSTTEATEATSKIGHRTEHPQRAELRTGLRELTQGPLSVAHSASGAGAAAAQEIRLPAAVAARAELDRGPEAVEAAEAARPTVRELLVRAATAALELSSWCRTCE